MKGVCAIIVSKRREVIGAVVEQAILADTHELRMARIGRRALVGIVSAL